MYCNNCGREIDGKNKFCPYCGAELNVYIKANNSDKPQKRTPKKKILFVIIVIILLILGLLGYCSRTKGNKVPANVLESDKQFSIYNLDLANVQHDSDLGIDYVNNMIIILFDPSATEQEKQAVISSIEGTVKGQMESINQYQVEITEKDLKELQEICDNIITNPSVLYATYDVAIDSNILSDAIPNDKWGWNNKWDENNPSGNNWWSEAIQAPSAWDYNDKFSNVKIGVIDSGFDYGHEDLKNKISFLSKNNEELNNKEKHGTHVAGIIGACANNKKGITGIVWNSELLCYDWKPTWIQDKITDWNTETFIYGGFIRAVESGAKIINFSIGKSGELKDNQHIYSAESIDREGRTASAYMASLLLTGNDFVVVQSAGNGAKDGIGVDAIYNGLFSSVTEDNCEYITDKVSKADVMERIIIVGNALNNGSNNYIQSKSSNGGAQVDICAPGTDIYSTVPGDWTRFQFSGGYGKSSGTSMAAPMVTGVAALVWSANTNLTGAKVKQIVCDENNTIYNVEDTPDSPNAVGTYRMVNAKLAVEAALNMENTDDLTADTNTYGYGHGTLTGVIKKEQWTHATMGEMTSYILELDSPANFKLQGDYEVNNVSEVQIWDSSVDEKYIGKKVEVTGDISRQAGTIYYRRDVIIMPSNITLVDGEESSLPTSLPVSSQQTKSPASNNKEILEIRTTDDLVAFSANVNAGNSYSGKTVTLLNDIVFDANTVGNFDSIGKTDKPFSGAFEGNNHSISGINIYHERDYVGLFGCITNGSVQNLTVNNAIIKGCSDVGIIAGGIFNSTIYNCTTSGELAVSKRTTSSGAQFGGVVGFSDGGIISNCISNASIDATSHIGGIVGDARQSNIVDCENDGSIDSSTGPSGGIVGSLGYGGSSAIIQNCSNHGELRGYTNGLAGIVGEVHTGSGVAWSYNDGYIDGFSVAGIAGLNHGSVNDCYNTGTLKASSGVGGISFTCSRGGNVENCYNAGNLTGRSIGGISNSMGNRDTQGDGGAIRNCYYLNTTASQGVIGDTDDGIISNVIGVSEAELSSTDFVNILNSNIISEEGIKPWKKGTPYPILD